MANNAGNGGQSAAGDTSTAPNQVWDQQQLRIQQSMPAKAAANQVAAAKAAKAAEDSILGRNNKVIKSITTGYPASRTPRKGS